MLLTFFYMVATWVQAWRLSSLRARLNTFLQGSDSLRPSIMFYVKPPICAKEGLNENKTITSSGNGASEDFLSSNLCSNKHIAKLGDLVWYQGDKRLCTIYPQQKIDVSEWLKYPFGKTLFPLCSHNYGQAALYQDHKMHILIEAQVENYNTVALTKATKLEDYGLIVAWTLDKNIGLILETDLDHVTKLAIALMHGQCFVNNGLLLTRVQSVLVSGKPCTYNSKQFSPLLNKKLMNKAHWDMHVKKLQIFSNTAKLVSQRGMALEVMDTPGIFVSQGNEAITLQAPTILEITIPSDSAADDKEGLSDSPVPSTPPPTPASASAIINGMASRLSQALTNSIDLSPTISLGTTASLGTSRSQDPIFKDDSNTDTASTENFQTMSDPSECFEDTIEKTASASSETLSAKTLPLTSTANYSPSKKAECTSNNYAKPPNILIYADSALVTDNVKNVLESTLNGNKYVIYTLSREEARSDSWMDQAVLVVVCGNVGGEVASQLIEYIVRGGKLLALCSDALHTLLPSFKTAEVREHELVRFSYGKWKHVRMMHHIFCYQVSPAKTRFSQDHEDVKVAAPQTPASANVRDKAGKSHTFHVRVLGTEETWHTPSLLLASLPTSGGKAVFSQIHLEADPSQYEYEESKFHALKQSNATRLEIFSDLLASHLGMNISSEPRVQPVYGPGYFLGTHELKLEMLERLKDKIQPNDVLKTNKLEIQFCGRNTKPMSASSSLLPVMVYQCPENFSTLEYFENLTSEELGRLVIYADIMTSSMDVLAGCQLHHGLVVIPNQQTKGQGRSNNVWLSPKGCAMFTLQLHISLDTTLGKHISLLQHLVAVAILSAVKSIPGYEEIDLRLKWPNDIYAGCTTKIGGLVVSTIIESSTAICNIGVGVNLSNGEPTCCINDIIVRYNEQHGKNLQKLSYERFLALIFSELERLLNVVQNNNIHHLYEMYYEYWMHTDANVTVISPSGTSQETKILGIDESGFLQVQGEHGNIFAVHPDGNSFDIFKGLIAPKK